MKLLDTKPYMFILFRDGRLGNQILQYFAATNCAGKNTLVLFGYVDLLQILDEVPRAHIFLPNLFNLALKAIDRLKHRYRYLKSLPVPHVSLVTERDTAHPLFLSHPFQFSTSNSRLQIFQNIFGLHDSFHHQRQLFKSHPSKMLASRVSSWMEKRHISCLDTGFLHIRLGDYRSLENDGTAYAMPREYYEQAATLLLTERRLSKIVIFSDEPDLVEPLKVDTRINYLLGPKDPILAWGVMNSLYSGVLSASTFSLSAALFGIDHKPDPLFIRPPIWPGAGFIDPSTQRTCYFKQLYVFNS